MSAEETGPDQHRNKRAKTDLACDTCRRRKSRCDGRRPACSHCENAGLTCSYRPTATNLETDASVLGRLRLAETRIDILENQLRSVIARPNNDEHPVEEIQENANIPDFHTAAAHKILQYWPRLRVKLTIPETEPLRFMREVDRDEVSLTSVNIRVQREYDISPMIDCVESLFQNTSELPVPLAVLLSVSPSLSRDSISKRLYDARDAGQYTFDLAEGTVEELLIQTLALRYILPVPDDFRWPSPEACFKLAMETTWKVFAESDVQAISTSFLYVIILLYFFGRPFHALGILQAVGPRIKRFMKLASDDEHVSHQQEIFPNMYYLLESDILTELDGVPMFESIQLINDQIVVQSADDEPADRYFQSELLLRTCLNKVLSSLYTVEKAYVHPHDAGPITSRLTRELDNWYQSLPLDMQFIRNTSSFYLSSGVMSASQRDISLRYYECLFVMNRTILYFLIHEDMEKSATTQSTNHGFEPWVLDACRSCTENASLIILTQHAQSISTDPLRYHSWCELQLLIGAYAVLLQAKAAPPLTPLFRDPEEVDHLLDFAETVFERIPYTSLGLQKTLEVLRNIRHNFMLGAPM